MNTDKEIISHHSWSITKGRGVLWLHPYPILMMEINCTLLYECINSHISFMASWFTCIDLNHRQMDIQKLQHANSTENIKALYYFLYVRGIHRWPIGSLYGVPVMMAAFSYDIIVTVTKMGDDLFWFLLSPWHHIAVIQADVSTTRFSPEYLQHISYRSSSRGI